MIKTSADEIHFPTPICPDTAPHAKHRIEGTWRTECPGVKIAQSRVCPDCGGQCLHPDEHGYRDAAK
jgi:hypothetical protein